MANPTSAGAKFQEHPMLRKLLAAGAADSMTYWGYVGPSTASGRISFYPSLNNLSVSLEISIDDIIHVEDVPETILPFGAKVIWIKKDASIGRRFEVEGSWSAAVRNDLVEVKKGRLVMQAASATARGRLLVSMQHVPYGLQRVSVNLPCEGVTVPPTSTAVQSAVLARRTNLHPRTPSVRRSQ